MGDAVPASSDAAKCPCNAIRVVSKQGSRHARKAGREAGRKAFWRSPRVVMQHRDPRRVRVVRAVVASVGREDDMHQWLNERVSWWRVLT